MIQSSRIVPFHARGESDSPHRVKKNVYLLMYGLIASLSTAAAK
jgi:hypothetical protein